MRAILIDVYNKDVKEVNIDDSLKTKYKLIGCDIFTIVSLDESHDIYVDDEGFLKGIHFGFAFQNYRQPIMGNGLVVKIGDQGEDLDAELSVEWIKQHVTFVDLDNDPSIPPIQIFTW